MSPNPFYEAGDRFEKRVKTQLEADGYLVWQTRGSKSPADLVAAKRGQLLLIQCKTHPGLITSTGWNALYDWAQRCAALPVVADRGDAHSGWAVSYRRITGHNPPRSRLWPAEDWVPGTVA